MFLQGAYIANPRGVGTNILGIINTNFCIQFRITLKCILVPRTKKIPHCAVKFKADEENRIVYKSFYCFAKTANDKNWTEGGYMSLVPHSTRSVTGDICNRFFWFEFSGNILKTGSFWPVFYI